MNKWSPKYKSDACRKCRTSDRPHHARGLCRRCYAKSPRALLQRAEWKKKNPEKVRLIEKRCTMKRSDRLAAYSRERMKDPRAREMARDCNRRCRKRFKKLHGFGADVQWHAGVVVENDFGYTGICQGLASRVGNRYTVLVKMDITGESVFHYTTDLKRLGKI